MSAVENKFYPKGTLLTLKAHSTSPQMKHMPLVVSEGAVVETLYDKFIIPNTTNLVWVKVPQSRLNNLEVTWNDSDYGKDRYVQMTGPFNIDADKIKSIGVTTGGEKAASLDKLTVAELRAKAAKRKISLTGLTKKADILAKIRGKK